MMFFRCFKLWMLMFVAVCLPSGLVLALTNNLALTPQMGWNDWNSYGCGISEAAVTNTANLMATNGMRAAGYQYVNIDDGWASSRNAYGVIQAYSISSKFPHGIKWLADDVHSKGLKLGIYTDHGTNTCSHCISTSISPTGKQPGSYGYEYLDAFTYASWGVDYLKNDSCNLPANDVPYDDYFRMADGLMKSGRPVFVSLCPNRRHYEYWSPDVGNSWRTTGDIGSTFASMISKIDQNSRSAYLAGPGRWNDPDMLEIGNGEFATNLVAAQTHFTMWCIMAAPLIAGNNLTTMSPQTLAILTNAEAIAVDQDPAGEQGVFVGGVKDSAEVWSKPLGYDFTTRAVALLNRSETSPATITCYWTNLAFPAGTTATVRDLWTHQDLGSFNNSFTATVPPYGSRLLKIVGTPLPPPGLGTNYLSNLQPIYAYTGYGTETKDKSIGGNPITLNGVVYANGIGTHAIGGQEYDLGGVCSRFHAVIGVDDEVGTNGSVIFQVFADGRRIYESGIMTGGAPAQTIDLDMTGVRRLTLGVTDTGNDASGNRNAYDHSDWADALVVVTNTRPQLPEAPTGLAANSGNAITLTWNPSLAAIIYDVKRASASGGPYTTITNVPITTFTDSNVVSGTTYYYVVSAISSFGEGSNSTEVAAAPCSPPSVPTGVTTTSTNSQIIVNWNASPGATSYTVSRFTAHTPPVVLATGWSATNFTDTAVAGGGVTYYYLVAAANGCSQSAYAKFVPAMVAPAAPTGLVAAGGDREVALNWNAPLGAASYNVKRSTTDGGPYAVIASGVTLTGYLDLSVTNGITYYYVVSAVNAGGESPNSEQAGVTPSAPPTAYWNNTLTGTAQNWNDNSNWTNTTTFPNGVGVVAIINANIAAPQTINLNQAITLGSLTLGDPDGSASYTLSANGGSLFFSGAGDTLLTELSSSKGDTIATPVTLTTNLIVVNNSTNPLILAGPFSSSGGTLSIDSGTVQVGDGTVNGSLDSVSVVDDTALVFNRSDASTMSGVISGFGTVTKTGAGTLLLSGANSFTGGTTISGGTVKMGNGSALGGAGGAVVVTNGGTLDLDGNNLGAEPVAVSGWGISSNGAIVSSAASPQYNALEHVTLTGDTAFGGPGNWLAGGNPGRWDIRGSGTTLSTGGQPYNLYKVGSNQVSIVGATVDPALANIVIRQGMLGFEDGSSSMGNPADTLTVDAGGTLEFYQSSAPANSYTKQFVLYGGGPTPCITNWPGGGSTTIAGRMTLNGVCVIAVNGTSLTNNCAIVGSGSLIKGGAAPLVLRGVDTYTGDTTVSGGAMLLEGSGSIADSAVLTVVAGATLDASQRGDGTLTVAAGQTLTGNGTVNGNVLVAAGATLVPGGSLTTLTFGNNLALDVGSRTVMGVNPSAVLTNDVAQVTGTLAYGGTLVITNIGAGAFAAGDSFKLFNAASYSGGFGNIVPAIPALNLAWDTNELDNGIVSVIASPTLSPEFGNMAVSGGNFILTGSNGVPDWPYYVLTSTNLALPLAEWAPIATNSFDGNGNFSVTNVLRPNAGQEFYLLQLQ